MTVLSRRNVLLASLSAPLVAACDSTTARRGPRSSDAASNAPLGTVGPGAGPLPERAVWRPEATRALVVCLAQFEGDAPGSSTWSLTERNDGAFVELLRRRGVPDAQLVFLMDAAATREAIAARLAAAIAASQPGETLLLYLGSHGSYSAAKNKHGLSAFDGHVDVDPLLDTIEQGFRGSTVMLFSDTCYSGGIAEKAGQRAASRPGKGFAYAALSSTGPHQVAWSGWRFLDALARGFSGRGVVDVNRDGAVSFQDLAAFTERHMAFVAEGKPTIVTTTGLPASLELAHVETPAAPRVGEYLEVEWPAPPAGAPRGRGRFYAAEVLDARADQLRVHYTANTKTTSDEWVHIDLVRPAAPRTYTVGEAVEIASSAKAWYPGKVKARFESLYLCSYDGWSPAYDEWFGPSRMRPLAASGGAVGATLPPPSDDLPK